MIGSTNQTRFSKTKAAGFGSEPFPTDAVPAGSAGTRQCTKCEGAVCLSSTGSCNHCTCMCVLFPCRYQCHTIYSADRDEAQQMFPERERSLVKMEPHQLKCPRQNISFPEAHWWIFLFALPHPHLLIHPLALALHRIPVWKIKET